MSLISVPQAQDGVTGVNASAINTPVNTIADDYNGNITNANIASGATIDFSKVAGGTSTALGAWQTWTPTLANLSGGTVTFAKYNQVGKTVYFRFCYTLAGAGVSTAPTFTLPVTASSDYTATRDAPESRVQLIDTGVASYPGSLRFNSTTVCQILYQNAAGTSLLEGSITSALPFTWGSGDTLSCAGTYEAA